MSSEIYEADYAPIDNGEPFGLWRDGQFVVVEIAAHRFPDRCLKTDVPIQGQHTGLDLTTYNVLTDELDLVQTVYVSTSRLPLRISRNNKGNNVVVPLLVPLAPELRQKVASRFGLYLAIGSIVFTLACFVSLFFVLHDAWILAPILGCVFGVIGVIAGFTLMALRTHRVLSIKRLADRKIWLRGAHPDWLARLPKYEISPELLAREYKRAVSSVWWSFGTAIVFAVAAAVCIPMAIYGFYHGLASRDWPEAQAHVHGATISAHRSKSSRWWTVDFQYEFLIENQQYSGSGSERSETEAEAQINLQNKTDGTPITAYYNPARPADNRLERGISDSEVGWMVAAVIVSLISLVAAGFGIVSRGRAAAFRLQMDLMVGPLDDPAADRFANTAN